MGTGPSHHEPLDRAGIRLSRRMDKLSRSFRGDKSLKQRTSPRRMDRLRRSLRESFRKRGKDAAAHVPEAAKPHQWQSDEHAVRAGTCSFHVKYLGCVEVFESRGMQVCEEALKVLRSNTRRRPVKAILYVSGDGLRVVEDETKGLIVDQTIEKVSFCAPDRNHEKGFSYICRDGTTRRWMCHGFLALRESGERLSHAVGCAFAACLERKQRREKECGVTMTFDAKTSTFTRTGSFRTTTITERLADPQLAKPAVADLVEGEGINAPPPVKPAWNPYAIERPHATPSMLERQGSFRGFQQLPGASPFKRQLSLRISDMPSNLERQRSLSLEGNSDQRIPHAFASLKAQVSPIPEIPATTAVADPVSAMCQQLSQGLSLLTSTTDYLDRSGNGRGGGDTITFSPSTEEKSIVKEPTVETNAVNLPKPEQWLGTVVQSVVSSRAEDASTTSGPSRTPSPRRPPSLAHLRALSVGADALFVNGSVTGLSGSANSIGGSSSNSSSGIGTTTSGTVSMNSGTFPGSATTAATTTKDPFDADWVASTAATNPFLTTTGSTPSKAPAAAKLFEVSL